MSAPLPTIIDPQRNWFIANGKKYYIQTHITMGRLKAYKRLLHTLVWDADVSAHLKFVDFVIDQMSGPVTFLATHKILSNAFNVKEAYENFIHDDIEPWFRFGALFINREGENIAEWNESIVQSKIEDWIKEGISVESFFFICAKLEPILRRKLILSHPAFQTLDKEEEE